MDAYLRNLRAKVGHDLIKAPCAGIVPRDDQGRIGLVRRSDDGTWGLVGGWMGPGENVLESAVREMLEETGYTVEVTGLLGIYSEPAQMRWTYPNGDQAEFVTTVFEAKILEKVGETDGEALEFTFFKSEDLPEIRLNDAQIIRDALSDGSRPFIR
jgi:8-oxo-dGTP pyrophosphatase MutT (NUDIX family)